MSEVVIKLERREDGGYNYTADGDGFSAGGGRKDANAMLIALENVLVIIEDRAGGGSGMP